MANWIKKYAAKDATAARRKARAAAAPYASGAKKEPTWTAKSRAQYGSHLPPKKAAELIYQQELGDAGRSGSRSSGSGVRAARAGKKATAAERGTGRKTSRGGKWTLAKANVGRAKDGTFKKKR